jgi:hypothetical protein
LGLYVFFAFLSGISALVYQVVWTRLVALLLGSQIEAISIVLVAFFGGLALGSRILGAAADRTRRPLRLFGGLEAGAGALAIASPFLLGWIGAVSLPHLPASFRLIGAAALLFPIPFLLGGTSPALTRCAVREVARSASGAGWIVGANTGGAVLGVAIAVGLIPAAGLRASLLGAGGVACLVGLLALTLARPVSSEPNRDPAPPTPVPGLVLAAASLAGMATLGLEVLAARAAALLLGSSLYAWGLVLALLLAGLAIGTGFFGGRAARSGNPALDLGLVELGAAVTLALGLTWLVPDASLPARGLTPRTLFTISACIFPPALLAGGAFPFFVRLGVRQLAALGRAFGTVSAVNTAGGIAGALLAPFLILPWLGLHGGLLACAALNALLAAVFLFRSSALPRDRWVRALGAVLLVLVVASPALRPAAPSPKRRVLHLDHGRQASVAVVRAGGLRELIVDGDPEAATGGDALETEELLGVLPLLLHPAPRRFLEVGLGSGITLATAARFPLDPPPGSENPDSPWRRPGLPGAAPGPLRRDRGQHAPPLVDRRHGPLFARILPARRDGAAPGGDGRPVDPALPHRRRSPGGDLPDLLSRLP